MSKQRKGNGKNKLTPTVGSLDQSGLNQTETNNLLLDKGGGFTGYTDQNEVQPEDLNGHLKMIEKQLYEATVNDE